ncbi:PIN domain-containing protein [Pseudomonas sp. SO81]|uniref:type II toxin-antitoxin system VapC family toxin n=1 Tax=Pseudomonas sp. SO81 TaxID=2983246 RepID=UPI0025A4542B|nr:PIN domain-containing protein [Pseudomonas sp. SO81]WJN60908.1 hypothetical protein OH686_19360 [Pseudomonas sp. SO81]
MRVVLDTNILIQTLRNAKAGAQLYDPETGEPVDRLEARAEALIEQIDSKDGVVLIPAPVLAEYLIGVAHDAYQTHLDLIGGTSCFEVVPFDQIAAIECALMVNDEELRALDTVASKAKLRVDRQIIAIALANNADELWTHDVGLYKKAVSCGLSCKSLAHILPKPEQLEVSLNDGAA